MNFEVEINEVDTHLSITAAGHYELPDLSSLFDKVNEVADKRGYRKILLDISVVAGAIPFLDMFVLGEHCARVWDRQLRIAIVSRQGGLDKFFENVARNRGVFLAVVPNHDAALAWLES